MHSSAHLPLRCCIIGATGFIGGQVARAAIDQGWRVRAVRRRPDAVGAIGDLPVEWVTGDLMDRASLVSAMRDCPLVFHVAGHYPQRSCDIWQAVQHGVIGMRHVLTAAPIAGIKRLIYTSALTTIGPPGEPGRLANESDPYIPGSVPNAYFESKWAMEMEAMRAFGRGVPVVIVNPTTTFGPGDVKPTSGKALLMLAKGLIPGYIAGTINVVDSRDVATGHIAAAQHGRPGRRYILGGHNLTFEEMLATMASAAGRRTPRVRLPGWSAKVLGQAGCLLGVTGSAVLQAIDQFQPLDTSHARSELKLGEPIPFEQTCLDTLAWFRQHGYLKGNQPAATSPAQPGADGSRSGQGPDGTSEQPSTSARP
jgi:dihydroflavonol-4-reductase